MKAAATVLLPTAVLTGCGWVEKLLGEEGKKASHGRAEPIAHAELMKLLPELQGWEAAPAEGKTSNNPEGNISSASRSYEQKGEQRTSTLNLRVVDGNRISAAYAPLAILSHSRGPTDVHKMRIEIDGHSGVQEWRTQSGEVTVALMVAGRFMVVLQGKNVTADTVKHVLHSVDLKKVASWADSDPAAVRTGS